MELKELGNTISAKVSKLPVEGWAEDFKDAADEALERAKDGLYRAGDKLATTVKEQPLASLAVGFGIGTVLGLLWGRMMNGRNDGV